MSEDLTDKLPKSDSEKLNIILTTVQSLENRVHRLEEQADEKRYDTRPLWKKLEADIAELKDSLQTETREIKRSLKDLSRKQSVLNDSILQIHGDLRDIDMRLLALEDIHNQQNSST
jgi:predicted  nucleic acid-binding Zn-ribbon protein